jgi:ATP-dependent 26S proteasome regulatory subunit
MQFLNRDDKKEEVENPQDVLEEMVGDDEEVCEENEVCEDEGEITLDAYFRASYPLLWIRTEEDQRALELIRTNISRLKKTSKIIVWSEYKHTTGLHVSDTPGVLSIDYNSSKKLTDTPIGALQYIPDNVKTKKDNPVLLVMHNVNSAMKVPQFIQQLKDTAYYSRLLGCHIILIGAVLDIPPELKSMVTVYDLSLPNKEFFVESFGQLAKKYKKMLDHKATTEEIDVLAQGAVGMTALQGENSIALTISAKKRLDPEVIQLEKEQAIKRNEVLEFIHRRENLEHLGGWYAYKKWLEERRIALSSEARDYGLRFPKGVLVAGVPGCGKSLAARVTSTYFGIPLLKFDMGKVFQSLVGQSEATIRMMAKTAEAVAPVVLWIEEIEKSAAGSQSSGSTDSGTTARVMATMLTWMQETTKPIFFYATCNNVESMPPELYRRGRFTEIWGVAEPDEVERNDIWEIMLKKVRPEIYKEAYDYPGLVKASEMYTGAEIEVAVENAMFSAFKDKREFETNDLAIAINEMKPQHIISKKSIDRTRGWMKEKVRMVSDSVVLSADEKEVSDGWDEIREIKGD